MKLNGWQRLWIVVSVLWLIPVLVAVYSPWPSRPPPFVRSPKRLYTVKDKGNGQTRQLELSHPQRPLVDADFRDLRTWLVQQTEITPESEFNEIVDIPGIGEVPFTVWRQEDDSGHAEPRHMTDAEVTAAAMKLYRDHVHTIRRQQLALTGKATAAWLLSISALYALGWAVGWIRRGFAG